jgi:hypothetical protein
MNLTAKELLTTADIGLLIHALKTYAGRARRNPKLRGEMSRLAIKVEGLYPGHWRDEQQKARSGQRKAPSSCPRDTPGPMACACFQ